MKEEILYDNGEYMLTHKGNLYYVYHYTTVRGNTFNLFGFRFKTLASANRVYTKCVKGLK